MNARIPAAGATLALLVVVLTAGSASAVSRSEPQLDLAGFGGLADSGHDGDGVTIAIVDSGIDLEHAELTDHLVTGIDLVDGDDSPQDENGHGTHVAGIALSGAPRASLMPVRVLDASGAGASDRVAEGVRWAAAHGADVINVSIGDSGALDRVRKSSDLGVAIREVADRAVVVAAAGNDDQFERTFRSGVPALVANAVDDGGAPAPFSNFGSASSVAAPGVDVVSTTPTGATTLFPDGTDGHGSLSGTSMAAPLVSAEAALVLQAGASATDTVDLVQDTARNPSGDPALGHGIIDAGAAVSSVPETAAAATVSPYAPGEPTVAGDEASQWWRRPAVVAVAGVALGGGLLSLVQRRRRRRES